MPRAAEGVRSVRGLTLLQSESKQSLLEFCTPGLHACLVGFPFHSLVAPLAYMLACHVSFPSSSMAHVALDVLCSEDESVFRDDIRAVPCMAVSVGDAMNAGREAEKAR